MCTINDDLTISPCGGLWPEEAHTAAWHPHINCPQCSDERAATHVDLTTWLVQHAGRRVAWSDVAEKLMRDFRVLRKETTP